MVTIAMSTDYQASVYHPSYPHIPQSNISIMSSCHYVRVQFVPFDLAWTSWKQYFSHKII